MQEYSVVLQFGENPSRNLMLSKVRGFSRYLPGKLVTVDLGPSVRTMLTGPTRWRTSEDPLAVSLENVVAGLLAQLVQPPVQFLVL